MKTKSAIYVVAVLLAAPVFAADRETLTFGSGEPGAKQVEKFLFPEAQCDNAVYQCLAVRPSVERSIGIDVRFPTASAELTPEAKSQLDGVGKALAARGGRLQAGEIVVEGHTDARGSAELNKKLSERRAQSVAKHLAAEYGVNPTVLKPVGKGKEALKDAARPDSEVNRRVELVRVSNN